MSITDDDLRERSEALHRAQESWEEYSYLATPKMPCPECSGAGQVAGGSLGDICVRCEGSRVIDRPGARPPEMPPFAALRAAITAYGNALADRQLPNDHYGKRHLVLPAADTVPTLEQISALANEAAGKARQLDGAAPGIVPSHMLADPRPEKGLRGEGDLGEFADAELNEIEDEEQAMPPGVER